MILSFVLKAAFVLPSVLLFWAILYWAVARRKALKHTWKAISAHILIVTSISAMFIDISDTTGDGNLSGSYAGQFLLSLISCAVLRLQSMKNPETAEGGVRIEDQSN